jgi:hypothetical protein
MQKIPVDCRMVHLTSDLTNSMDYENTTTTLRDLTYSVDYENTIKSSYGSLSSTHENTNVWENCRLVTAQIIFRE